MYLPKIKIFFDGNNIIVKSPYHESFPPEAKKLGGKWDGSAWRFDSRLEREVRELVIRIYGWDGSYPVRVADVRVILDRLPESWQFNQSLWLLGRELAYRPSRDAEVRLGDGVVVEAGGFAPFSGSRKRPTLAWKPGTVLRALDVPVAKIQAVQEKHPEAIEIVEGSLRDVLGPDRVIPAAAPEMSPAAGSGEPVEEVPAGRWQVACPACGLFPFKGQGPAGGMGPCPQGCGRIAVFLPLPPEEGGRS